MTTTRFAMALGAIAMLGCGSTVGTTANFVQPSGPAIYDLKISHRDEMRAGFVLTHIALSLDGRPLYDQTLPEFDPATGDPPRFAAGQCLYQGTVAAGSHDVELQLNYRGHGNGVFSYIRDYRFESNSTHRVLVRPASDPIHLSSVGLERGGVTTPLEERPSVRFEEVHASNSACGASQR